MRLDNLDIVNGMPAAADEAIHGSMFGFDWGSIGSSERPLSEEERAAKHNERNTQLHMRRRLEDMFPDCECFTRSPGMCSPEWDIETGRESLRGTSNVLVYTQKGIDRVQAELDYLGPLLLAQGKKRRPAFSTGSIVGAHNWATGGVVTVTA